MANKETMIFIFLISLFSTFAIVRFWAHIGHDMNMYGTRHESSKTLTGWLRKKTGFDWHHIHFGIIIFIIASFWIYFSKVSSINISLLGVGLSMILDQISPLLNMGNYFSKKMIFVALLLHIITASIAIKILN